MTDYAPSEINIQLPKKYLLEDLIINHERNRKVIRELVVNEILKERAGTGTGALAANYKYIVERLSGGGTIYLTRPAVLNKGFDFVVHVEGFIFANGRDNPTHGDILRDLTSKINSIPDDQKIGYRKSLVEILESVYYCADPESITKNCTELEGHFDAVPGYDYEMICRVVKWLFIEQDITYWNWSGRAMLMRGLRDSLGE